MEESRGCHVVALPWLAFGHLLPFLELSKSLAARGIKVSFISTPRNLQRLPVIPPHLASQIDLVNFPLPFVDGLPENAEATVDLQLGDVPYLKKAYDGLEEPFSGFVAATSPDWIVYDCITFWAPRVATRFGVPCAFFSVHSAATPSFMGPPWAIAGDRGRSKPEDFTVVPKWIDFPSTVKFRHYEAVSLFSDLGENVSGVPDPVRFTTVIEGCQTVLIRSCMEYEGAYLNVAKDVYGKPLKPVGLLPPAQDLWDSTPVGSEWASRFRWLDEQAPKSVVLVGFGSEFKLSVEQMHELAFGLETSNLPFIWLLRNPLGVPEEVDVLPEGFRARVAPRGLVCMGWAPQIKIMAHPSIGGYLFHSGWGSIVEALQFGLPLILAPMIIDQGLNARLAAEKKIGIEIERDEKDGRFTRVEVAKALRLVMVEAEGEPLRAKAREMMPIFAANKSLHDSYMDEVVEYLVGYQRAKVH